MSEFALHRAGWRQYVRIKGRIVVVTAPSCVVGHFGHKKLLSKTCEKHNLLGFEETTTIVGAITYSQKR